VRGLAEHVSAESKGGGGWVGRLTNDGVPLIDGRGSVRRMRGRWTYEARANEGAEPLCLEEEMPLQFH
jgi:hypothetical protein